MLNPYKNTDQVNAVIKVRRGPEIDRAEVVYEDGELIYSTDKKRLFVGDGLGDEGTEGGNLVGNKLWISDSFNSVNLPYIEKYDMVYRPSTTGFYILTGDSIIDPNSYLLVGGKELIPQISTFTLPKATNSSLGGVIVKTGLSIDVNGNLNVDFDSNTLGLIGNKLTVIGGTGGGTGESIGNASYTAYGKIRVLENTGLLINSGNLSVSIDNRTIKLSSIDGINKLYVDSSEIEITNLPKATTSSLGAIVVGDGLVINNGNGILSVKSATPTTIGGVKPGDALSANPLNSKLDVIVDNNTIIVNAQNQLEATGLNGFYINGSMLAKAWVSFNGDKDTTGANSTSNTNRLINASYNVDSVSRNKQGEYKINFKPGTFNNANYCYTFGMRTDSDGTYQEVLVTYGEKSLSALVIQADDDDQPELTDLSEICLTFYASGGDLLGSANVFDSTPIGTINYFAASAAPVGYLECNGDIVEKTLYSDLYNVIKDTYTPVLSANHFKLPDLRGEFIRGWDHDRGVDSGRTLGSWQKGTLVGHDNTSSTYGVVGVVYTGGEVIQTITLPAIGLDNYNVLDYPNIQLGSVTSTGNTTALPQFASNSGSSGTTRPRNITLLPCIKALKTVNGDTRTLDFIERNDFTGTNQSLTTNGYQKLPGGLIMQWGTQSFNSGTDNTTINITFSIPFPNTVFTVNGNASTSGLIVETTSTSTTSAVLTLTQREVAAFSAGVVKWTAFGF